MAGPAYGRGGQVRHHGIKITQRLRRIDLVQASGGRFSPAWRAAWGSWLGVTLLFFVIWLVSGASGGLWFLWVPGIMGVLLLGRWISGAPAHHERGPGRPRRDHRHRDSDY